MREWIPAVGVCVCGLFPSPFSRSRYAWLRIYGLRRARGLYENRDLTREDDPGSSDRYLPPRPPGRGVRTVTTTL